MAGKFFTIFLLLTLSLGGGYLCRKLRLAGDRAAGWLMTAVAVVGYPIVNLLAIWDTPLHASDLWLPGLSVAQIFLLTAAGLALGRLLTADRGERGLFAISSAFGNHGLTMGGFVVFLLFGEQALGLASIYFMLFTPITVLLAYPLARHYATDKPSGSLARLLLRSLFDWRSIGLPISFLGILFSPSVLALPRPAFIKDLNIVDMDRNDVRIIHNGEAECIALYKLIEADAFLVDERTTRHLIEAPEKLHEYMQSRLSRKIDVNMRAIELSKKVIGKMNVIRSSEVLAFAYENGLLNLEENKKTLEAALYALKFSGCSITEEEIQEYIKLLG